jgi:protocatechuate 3,4-dioxygenase beta subunit
LLLLLLFTLLLDPQEKPPERCTVSGTVVDSVTGQPLARVSVELRPTDRAAGYIATTRSDAEGHFKLVDVDAGSYRLAGTRAAYLETFYGARRSDSQGAALRLDAGQTLDDLTLKLIPAGLIEGRIYDADGDPVPGAHAILAQRRSRNGRPQVAGIDSTDANDEGVYRFSGLAAGKYHVVAELPRDDWGKVDHSPRSSGERQALQTTVYPGVLDVDGVSPLEIRPGERREGIDIRMLRSRVFRVRGRVVDAGPGPVALTLRSLRNEGISYHQPYTSTRNSAGDFEFSDVAPGSYRLDANHLAVPVEVGSADLDGVRVTAGQAAEVTMTIAVEGEEKPRTGIVRVVLQRERNHGGLVELPFVGKATMKPTEGKYDVEVWGVPRGLYIKSMRSGDRDVLADRLDVPAGGTIPLDIVLAADGARVAGSVTDADGKPVLGATVVLVPGVRTRADLYRRTTTDQYGAYTMADIPPGDYKLFAWEDVAEDDWVDPDFLKPFEKQGVDVMLAAKGRETAKVKVARVIP